MNKKIIIVEDEFIVADDLRMIVENAGYIVPGMASSVGEAIELINLHGPSLVLLDINLQGKLTGIDLAHQLREQAIPFIYISSYSNQSILEAANATQPYGFLVKPFRENDVLVAIDIARYRYKNSMESALQRERLLTKTLSDINNETDTPDNKLLKTAIALQSHIPFDYLAIAKKVKEDIPYKGISFLRLGVEEYQPIGVPELLTATGITLDDLKKMKSAIEMEVKPAWFNGESFTNVCKSNPLKNLLANTWMLKSNLTMPFVDMNNNDCLFSFYSRKKEAYQAEHIALLGRLYAILSIASNNISLSHHKDYTKDQAPHFNFEGIIGNDPALISVLDQLWQVAPFETSVLIQGETGTGKERVATCIHQLSGRSSGPLIKINCALLPHHLIETELFGHEKGAFTNAIERHIGKFEQANGGTVFLDEIGEMPLDIQSKLLRVLQEKEIERIGGKTLIKVNVRVIAATNRNLEKEVAEDRFRMDLFYRLNVFPLRLPPLRERKSDIPQLAHHFAQRFFKKFKKKFHGISDSMMNALMAYHWPGNVRELENIIEQNTVLNNGNSKLELNRPLINSNVDHDSLPDNPKNLQDIKKIQLETERNYLRAVLKKANGRIRGEGGAAQLLDLPPTTLESRMSKLGLKKEDYL